MFSNWWQLQDNTPSAVRGHIGYPVAILVHIFHPADTSVPSTPFKEKPDEQAPPQKLQPKAQRSTTPAEAREEGDEEELPQPIIPYAPRPADEDPDEQQVAIAPDWSSFDLGKALRKSTLIQHCYHCAATAYPSLALVARKVQQDENHLGNSRSSKSNSGPYTRCDRHVQGVQVMAKART